MADKWQEWWRKGVTAFDHLARAKQFADLLSAPRADSVAMIQRMVQAQTPQEFDRYELDFLQMCATVAVTPGQRVRAMELFSFAKHCEAVYHGGGQFRGFATGEG